MHKRLRGMLRVGVLSAAGMLLSVGNAEAQAPVRTYVAAPDKALTECIQPAGGTTITTLPPLAPITTPLRFEQSGDRPAPTGCRIISRSFTTGAPRENCRWPSLG